MQGTIGTRSRRGNVEVMCCLVCLGMLFCTPHAAGQLMPPADTIRIPRRVVAFEHVSRELVIKCDAGFLVIKAYADGIIHVHYSAARPKTTIIPPGVKAAPADVQYRVESNVVSLKLAAAQLAVTVDRKTARMTFLDRKQNVLLVSKQYRLREYWSPLSSGPSVHAEFQSPESEAFYGLGRNPEDRTNLRGQTVHITHNSLFGDESDAVPLLVTNRGYGFIFCNSSDTTVVLGESGVTTWDADSGDMLSYFVIFGATTDEIIRGYQNLTGKTPQ